MGIRVINFIRYPGGKQKLLNFIIPFLPARELIKGIYIEPFVGSGAVFFALNPNRAILSDINPELIDLYHGIRLYPHKVWKIYSSFPKTKAAYYKIRAIDSVKMKLAFRAARTLYLNRTCFKGMWRHNANGIFNVGYGGQDRRWVISEDILKEVSDRLKSAQIKCSDFEDIINNSTKDDFIFVDPPYSPGKSNMNNSHYRFGKFTFSEYQRLAKSLDRASKRSVKWAMTISSHPDILNLFTKYRIIIIPIGTGKQPGILTKDSGEALIINYNPEEMK
jgi:DNA adenine methylase